MSRLTEKPESLIDATKKIRNEYKSTIDKLDNILKKFREKIIRMEASIPELVRSKAIFSLELLGLIDELIDMISKTNIETTDRIIPHIEKIIDTLDKMNSKCCRLNKKLEKITKHRREIEELEKTKSKLEEEIERLKKDILGKYPLQVNDLISVTPIDHLLNAIEEFSKGLRTENNGLMAYCALRLVIRLLELTKQKIQNLKDNIERIIATDPDIEQLLDRYTNFRKRFLETKKRTLMSLVRIIGRLILLGMVYKALGYDTQSEEILAIAEIILNNAESTKYVGLLY